MSHLFKKLPITIIAALAAFGLHCTATNAAIIKPVGGSASSTNGAFDLVIGHTIDESALSAFVPPGDPNMVTHDGAGNNVVGNTWTSDNSQNVEDQYLRYDLGAAYHVTGMYVWNYDQYAGTGDQSHKAIRYIILGSQGPGGMIDDPYTVETPPIEFDRAPTDETSLTPSQFIDLSGYAITNARFLEFDIRENWLGTTNAAGNAGLGEVRFVGELVPEPSSLLLVVLGLGLGLFACGVRGRRQRKLA